MKRKRIAVIVPGGIGAGDFSQGYPPMMAFLDKLFESFDLTVYSLYPVNKDFRSTTYTVRSPPRFLKSSSLRIITLTLRFAFDHLWKRYHLLHGFWVFPAGTLTVILGKIFRAPTVVTVQGGEAAAFPEIPYGNMLRPRLKKITLWTCEQATCLNTISEFLVSQLKMHGLKRNDAVVIIFGSQRTAIDQEIDRSELRILHVANITPIKDQGTLLKAFQRIASQEKSSLTIIGGDYMNGEIQRMAETLGLSAQIKFLSSVPHNQLLPYYRNSQIMLHTSLHEGQSGVVTDAMARGVVVCGTRVGIISDLGEQYCQIAEVGDDEQLAKRTLEIWNNQLLFRQKRTAAWQWSQQHDDHWTVKEYVALYDTLTRK